jgi:hypothetical protein
MGRRRSARAEASAIALGVMAVAASAFAVYWLVIGAVWLVGTLLRAIVRQPKTQTTAVVTNMAVPVVESPSSLDYEEIAHAQALSSPDADLIRRATCAAFAAWARALPKAPRDPVGLIRGIEINRRLLVRRDSVVEGRRLLRRSAPHRSGTDTGSSNASLEEPDPWLPADELAARSSHVAACDACTGTRMVACSKCHGSCRVTCTNCEGAGKAYGFASNGSRRLMNCKVCAKAGQVDCSACMGGEVACSTCSGAGRIRYWYEAEVWNRVDVQVEPDDYQRVFHWSKDGNEASRNQIELDAWVVGESVADGPVPLKDAPEAIPPDDRDRILAAVRPHLEPGERIRQQRLMALEFPAVSVTYGSSLEEQTIDLMGRRLLAPRRWVDTAMRARARFLNVVAAVLALMPVAAGLAYLSRGSYFVSSDVAALVGCIAVAAVLMYFAVSSTTLGPRRLAWLAPVPLPLIAAVVFGLRAEPSIDAARHQLRQGHVSAALRELEALGSPERKELASAYADVRLAQVHAASTASDAAKALSRIPPEMTQHAAGQALVDERWLQEAARALETGHPADVSTIVAQASPELQSSPASVRLLAAADLAAGRQCLSDDDWKCALSRGRSAIAQGNADGEGLVAEALGGLRRSVDSAVATADATKELAPRVQALQLAEQHLAALEVEQNPEATDPSTELKKLHARLLRDVDALNKQKAAEARRAEAEAEKQRRALARQQAAEERALARQRAAEERVRRAEERSYSSLRCCDGSLSPSCTCGGSHRGCCSHHGGVCGCE